MNPGAQLKRDIGFFGAAFLVLNSVIGAGIFALPGKVAVSAGLYSPWLFLVVGLLFLTVVLTFAELASYYDRTGGPVLYATEAFGPLAGFSTGWLIYLARMTAFAANANVMAAYLASLSDVFASPTARVLIITIVTIGLTWANLRVAGSYGSDSDVFGAVDYWMGSDYSWDAGPNRGAGGGGTLVFQGTKDVILDRIDSNNDRPARWARQ